MLDVRLFHLTMADVTAGDFQVAVFPIGSTEPHSDHLPYGTDAIYVERTSELAVERANAEGARCLLLPTLPIGCNENVGHPWAISLRPRTLMEIVADMVRTAERNGIRKFVIINGHGGNTDVLRAAQRELASTCQSFVGLVEPWDIARHIEEAICETEERGHACETETSYMLHLAPEHVKMDRAHPVATRKTIFSDPDVVRFVSRFHIYTPDAAVGDPTKATADKGRQMTEAVLPRLARALKELSDAPITNLFPYRE